MDFGFKQRNYCHTNTGFQTTISQRNVTIDVTIGYGVRPQSRSYVIHDKPGVWCMVIPPGSSSSTSLHPTSADTLLPTAGKDHGTLDDNDSDTDSDIEHDSPNEK